MGKKNIQSGTEEFELFRDYWNLYKIVEGIGDGRSKARKLEKTPSEKDRLKAAELIGKRYGLFTDKIETDVDMDLNITIDYGDE